MSMTQRYSEEKQIITTATDATSPIIDISHYASGEVMIPTGETLVTLTYFAVDLAGNLYAMQDATPAAISQTVAADKAYPIPPLVMGAGRIQIRSNVAGHIRVTLKS